MTTIYTKYGGTHLAPVQDLFFDIESGTLSLLHGGQTINTAGGNLPPGVVGDGQVPGGMLVDGVVLLNGITLAQAQSVNAVLAVGPMTDFGPSFYVDNTGTVSIGQDAGLDVNGADGTGAWSVFHGGGQIYAIAVSGIGDVSLPGNSTIAQDGTGVLSNNQIAWNATGDFAVANQNIPANGGIGTTQMKLTPTAATGAPTTGTHEKGEMLMDAAGGLFVCVADGTPGTWKQATLV